MAMSLIYICDKCGLSLEAWDDGNPYIEYPGGKRHYFYHPNGEAILEKVTTDILGHSPTSEELEAICDQYAGNAPDHLCRDCGETSRIDPDKDKLVCQHCGSDKVVDLQALDGKKCIKCSGHFYPGGPGAIS